MNYVDTIWRTYTVQLFVRNNLKFVKKNLSYFLCLLFFASLYFFLNLSFYMEIIFLQTTWFPRFCLFTSGLFQVGSMFQFSNKYVPFSNLIVIVVTVFTGVNYYFLFIFFSAAECRQKDRFNQFKCTVVRYDSTWVFNQHE